MKQLFAAILAIILSASANLTLASAQGSDEYQQIINAANPPFCKDAKKEGWQKALCTEASKILYFKPDEPNRGSLKKAVQACEYTTLANQGLAYCCLSPDAGPPMPDCDKASPYVSIATGNDCTPTKSLAAKFPGKKFMTWFCTK